MNRQVPPPFLSDAVPSEPHDTRRSNRNRILRTLITRGPATRAELARLTGMSRPTVSVIAGELLGTGLLTEGERVSSGGAPGTLLEIAKDTGVIVALDLRDTARIGLATVSAAGRVVTRSTVAARSEKAVVAAVADFVSRIEPGAAIGTAVAVAGFVDPGGNWLRNSGNRLDVRVIEDLRNTLDLPVLAVNATDACTIADLRDSPEGLAGLMTVVVPAAAAGLVLEGSLLTGFRRPAGNIAHVVTATNGPTCPDCGHNCLYAQVSQLAADPSARIRRRTAVALAAALAPIVMAVEIEQVVLSGLPEGLSETMCELTAAELGRRLPPGAAPDLRSSTLGDDAALVGAATMMLFRQLG